MFNVFEDWQKYFIACVTYRGPYGFQAKAESDLGPGVLIFKNVTTNVGAGYDRNTGYFTTTRNGLFVFTWSVQSYEESILTVLKVNGQEKGHAKTLYQDFANNTATSFAVLRLISGDNVNIELINGTARKINTMFTGWAQYSSGNYLHKLIENMVVDHSVGRSYMLKSGTNFDLTKQCVIKCTFHWFRNIFGTLPIHDIPYRYLVFKKMK